MITRKQERKYKVRAWYYPPIYDNSGTSSLDWEKENPQLFYCAFIKKTKYGVAILPNGRATSNDTFIETLSTIEFDDKGKVSFDYINPVYANAERITKGGNGVELIYDDKAMAYGNKFRTNRFVKKRISLG